MSGEWKPGDVVLAEWYGDGAKMFFRVTDGECRKEYHSLADHWHSTAGTWAERIESAEWFRPLVVIDPENREQAERFAELVENCGDENHCVQYPCGSLSCWTDRIAAALHGFANPKPPCATCLDKALAGFTCNTCGNGANS